jgi:putative transposase
MRDALLNESLFLGLDHARTKTSNRVDDYNPLRPPSALGYLISRRQPMPPLSPQHAIVPATSDQLRRSHVATRAPWRKTRRGSKRRWMKVQWQVRRMQLRRGLVL